VGEGDEFVRLPVQKQAVAQPLHGLCGVIFFGIVIKAILQPDFLFYFYGLFSPFEQARGPEPSPWHPPPL